MKHVFLLGAGGLILLTIAAGLADRLNHSVMPTGAVATVAEPVEPVAAVVQASVVPDASSAGPDAAASAPSFDVVRVNPTGSTVIAGRATPGAEVTVLDADRPIGRATADGRGEWVLLPENPLSPGSRELSLVARSSDGGNETPSDEVVVLVVPEAEGKEPSTGVQPALRQAEGSPVASAFAVALPLQGGPSELLQAPAARGVTLDIVDYDDKGDVSVGGRAPAGSKVQLYLDGEPVASADADAKGQWRANPGRKVEPGTYTLRADQVGPDGRVASRAETPFQMASFADRPLSGNMTVVQPGNSLWRLARRAYGEGVLYTVIYEANQEQIRDPDLIYPGQIFIMPEVETSEAPS